MGAIFVNKTHYSRATRTLVEDSLLLRISPFRPFGPRLPLASIFHNPHTHTSSHRISFTIVSNHICTTIFLSFSISFNIILYTTAPLTLLLFALLITHAVRYNIISVDILSISEIRRAKIKIFVRADLKKIG